MCYSAMVEQSAKKYGLRFKARVQLDIYYDLFRRRLSGEKLLINRAMEDQFIHEPQDTEGEKIGRSIQAWRDLQIPNLERELAKQKERLAGAIGALQTKPTKKAENDKRIANNKIEKLQNDIEKLKSPKPPSEGDSRIFPLHYMSMLCIDENGEKVIRPVRYLMRPHDQNESFDSKFNGCYNARLDSLESVAWWRDCLGKRHGIILVSKFYENVESNDYRRNHELAVELHDKKNLVLCFQPDGVEFMFIPTLWDSWKGKDGSLLYSAALITDDPAPEIASTGHNRTPIFLDESAIDDWLMCKSNLLKEIRSILDRRVQPHYSHRIVQAA